MSTRLAPSGTNVATAASPHIDASSRPGTMSVNSVTSRGEAGASTLAPAGLVTAPSAHGSHAPSRSRVASSSRSVASTSERGNPGGGTSERRYSSGTRRSNSTYPCAASRNAAFSRSHGRTLRRDGSIGSDAISLTGNDNHSSVGVGACNRSAVSGSGRPAPSSGSAQRYPDPGSACVNQRWDAPPGPDSSTP